MGTHQFHHPKLGLNELSNMGIYTWNMGIIRVKQWSSTQIWNSGGYSLAFWHESRWPPISTNDLSIIRPIPNHVKLGLINPSRLINHHCPIFFGNLKTGGPPRLINTLAYPRLINHQCWHLFFKSNNFYFQLFFILSHQSQNSSLLYLRFKLIIENFKKQLFPKWSISN